MPARLLYFYSHFVLYLFQCTDLSSQFLESVGRFRLSFAHKVTAGTYNFVRLIIKIVKMMLLGLELVSSARATNKATLIQA